MYKFSISKELFENILLKKIDTIEKKATTYWKKEIFIPKIVDNSIVFKIRNFDKLTLVNGLGEDKPQIIVECLKVEYIEKDSVFKFYLGKIVEQKNITNFQDEKDILINQLLSEKSELIKILDDIRKRIK